MATEASPDVQAADETRPDRPFTDPLTGHRFQNASLYQRALTHTSASFEEARQPATQEAAGPSGRPVDNQQMEFLGDAILSLVVAEELYFAFPSAREGDLSRMRASVVSRDSLAAVANRLRLGRVLRLGRGEERSGGRRKPALLADALEALIAALYLDAGLPAATIFIRREILQPSMSALAVGLHENEQFGDYKTALQERLQAEGQTFRYLLQGETGPDHDRTFRVAIEVDQKDGSRHVLAEAEGPSKRKAQQEAARLALARRREQGLEGRDAGGT